MKLSDKCKDFIMKSSISADSNTLYLCDKNNCYIKAKMGNLVEYNIGEARVTKELKEYFDKVENVLIEKNKHIKVSDIDEDRNTNCFMIHNINDDLYLVSTNYFWEFQKEHVRYADTTTEFLRILTKE